MQAVVTGILSSTSSHAAQGTHSSHKQPLLATYRLVAPPFLPPAAVTARPAAPDPSSTPPICPYYAEQWCRADPATAAGNESTATSSCCTRTAILACGGSPHKTITYTPFCSLLLTVGVEQLRSMQPHSFSLSRSSS